MSIGLVFKCYNMLNREIKGGNLGLSSIFPKLYIQFTGVFCFRFYICLALQIVLLVGLTPVCARRASPSL